MSSGPMFESTRAVMRKGAEMQLLRTMAFLFTHFMLFFVQIFVLGLWISMSCYRFAVASAATMVFSTYICTQVAWHYKAPHIGRWCPCLPMREKSCFIALPLWILLGPCQGVIILLAVEDYLAHKSASYARDSTAVMLRRTPTMKFQKTFSCRAVISIFEGILTAWVICYGYCGVNFPENNPILITDAPQTLRMWLAIAALVALLVGGAGLVESDLNVSETVHGSCSVRVLHWLFRCSEVGSRLAVHIYITSVLWSARIWWWCGPFFADFCLTVSFVYMFGGCEVGPSLRFLCGVPCMFADLFFFVDAPSKRPAARKLSCILLARNLFAWLVLMLFLPPRSVSVRFRHQNFLDVSVLVACVCYVGTWSIFFAKQTCDDNTSLDIFEACSRGEAERVRELLDGSLGIEVDINLYDVDGYTPLMLASLSGRHACDVAALLIESGADLLTPMGYDARRFRRLCIKRVRRRWTVLHIAACQGSRALLSQLLQSPQVQDIRKHADMLKDTHGDTPAHIAVQKGHKEAASMLVKRMPELLQVKNARGLVPEDYARNNPMKNIVNQTNYSTYASDSVAVAVAKGSQALPLQRAHSTAEISRSHCIEVDDDPMGVAAPGLTSFLVGVAGGVQGQLFLKHLPPVPEQSALPSTAQPSTQLSARVNMQNLEPVDKKTGEPSPAIQEHMATFAHLDIALLSPMDRRAVIGQGGFGEVFRARDKTDHSKHYAVKVMRWRSDQDRSAIAKRESEVYTRIAFFPHPCTTDLFALHFCSPLQTPRGIQLGVAFVLEFCPHGDLTNGLISGLRGTFNESYTAPKYCGCWVGQIFLGLEHLHLKAGALMRDLKPDNILLDSHLNCKLTDFGYSKIGIRFQGWGSFKNTPPGTPGFAAPEVMKQERCSWPCDIYSFGITVWVMFSGGDRRRHPLAPPASSGRTPRDHVEDWILFLEALRDPARARGSVPDDVLALVQETTHRDPKKRLKHAGIRETTIMSRLDLPPRSDVEACRAWLSGAGAATNVRNGPSGASVEG